MKTWMKNMVVIVDYKNVADEATPEYKILDFEKLREKCLEIAPTIACFLFVPDHWVNKSSVAEAQKYGFHIICCYGVKELSDSIEDSVDIHIIKFVKDLIVSNKKITDICLVGSDKDMNHWVQSAQWVGQKIHIFTGKKLSHILRETVNSEDINSVPLKDGEV